jgi:hypothetical protein
MLKQKELQIEPVNFIQAYYLENIQICDDLIKFFKDNPLRQAPGASADPKTGKTKVMPDVKDSKDIWFLPDEPEPVWESYKAELVKCTNQYVETFPNSEQTARWGLVEYTNLQYYPPGGGYKSWHSERVCAISPYASRKLVFMTYLNDVTDRGETEFAHQKIKVRPEKGLTLIWPADWTHFHRGIVSPSQEKYIITGWMNYLD